MLAKNYKQFKCLSTNKWVNQMWCIHRMKYYSAVKKNKVLIHGTKLMNLEDYTICDSIYMK